MLELNCLFRGYAIQLPLREGDTVWLRRRGALQDLPGIPAEVVITLIAHHIFGIQLQERLRGAVMPARAAALPLIRGPVAPEIQEARRVKRRKRA